MLQDAVSSLHAWNVAGNRPYDWLEVQSRFAALLRGTSETLERNRMELFEVAINEVGRLKVTAECRSSADAIGHTQRGTIDRWLQFRQNEHRLVSADRRMAPILESVCRGPTPATQMVDQKIHDLEAVSHWSHAYCGTPLGFRTFR